MHPKPVAMDYILPAPVWLPRKARPEGGQGLLFWPEHLSAYAHMVVAHGFCPWADLSRAAPSPGIGLEGLTAVPQCPARSWFSVKTKLMPSTVIFYFLRKISHWPECLTDQNKPFPECARNLTEMDVCMSVHNFKNQPYLFPLTSYFDLILGL